MWELRVGEVWRRNGVPCIGTGSVPPDDGRSRDGRGRGCGAQPSMAGYWLLHWRSPRAPIHHHLKPGRPSTGWFPLVSPYRDSRRQHASAFNARAGTPGASCERKCKAESAGRRATCLSL